MAYTTIDDPTIYFNTVLYAGTGSEQTVSGVNFQPDWTWLKSRSNGQPHVVSDSVRGATKQLYTADGQAETSYSQYVKSFNSDGFVLGTDAQINQSSQTFVSWNWKAGTSFTNSAGANGADVASAGSVNTDAGFSIVTYSGTSASSKTIFHGLTAVPKMMLIKCRNNAENWSVYHKSMTALNGMYLNLTSAQAAVDLFADTEPTSSVFSVNQDSRSGENGKTYVAYCFAEKQGYSKISSYVGNGNADGPFIYTGFKPAWVLRKRTTSATGNWFLNDNKRDGFNGASSNDALLPNSTTAETDPGRIDLLANGYKVRHTDGDINASGETYIFAAFSENPFTTSTGVPATAR